MAGTYIGKYDTTAGSNSATASNSVSVAEGMLPSNINNALRDIMADVRQWYNTAEWIEYGDGAGTYTPAYASSTSFTIAGVNVTSVYHVGRRVKLVASTPGTIYGSITAVSFSTNTTVTIAWDSGSLSDEAITSVHIGAISASNTSLPETTAITGDYTLDVSGDIILDADGGDVRFKDGGTHIGSLYNSSNNFAIYSAVNNADMLLQGQDGGSTITALTLDMSSAGRAVFGAGATFNSDVYMNSHELYFADNGQARFGADEDLKIYHDGNNSIINEEGTGYLIVQTNGTGMLFQKGTTEDMAKFLIDGAVELYHNNVKKFETTAAGATVTGVLTATLQANAIDSDHYTDGSIDTAHIADGNVTAVKIGNDAINHADKIADGVIASEHYQDGSIDSEHLANDAVTADKLANSINTDIATGVTGNTTANAALPKAGGTMTGNLVVNTASPNVDLIDTGTSHASTDYITNSNAVRVTVGAERAAGGGLFVGSSAYAAVFGTASSGATEFATNNTVRMSITSDGRGLSQFTAKVWLYLNMATPAIVDSHNVSSVTDLSTGHFAINFSNNMANANYAHFCDGYDVNQNSALQIAHTTSTRASSSARIMGQDIAGNAQDLTDVNYLLFGD